MKTLAELEEIRKRTLDEMELRNSSSSTRIVVGMATCGIAAGARPVMATLLEEISKRGLKGITVTQTGCIGVCRLEPIIEVYQPNQEKITYVKLTPDKVSKIVLEHLANGKVCDEYTIGAAEK